MTILFELLVKTMLGTSSIVQVSSVNMEISFGRHLFSNFIVKNCSTSRFIAVFGAIYINVGVVEDYYC